METLNLGSDNNICLGFLLELDLCIKITQKNIIAYFKLQITWCLKCIHIAFQNLESNVQKCVLGLLHFNSKTHKLDTTI